MQGISWNWSKPSHRPLDSKLKAALAQIHAAGILHNDLHEGNILVTPDDQVFILDFAGSRQHASRKWLREEEEALMEELATKVC